MGFLLFFLVMYFAVGSLFMAAFLGENPSNEMLQKVGFGVLVQSYWTLFILVLLWLPLAAVLLWLQFTED